MGYDFDAACYGEEVVAMEGGVVERTRSNGSLDSLPNRVVIKSDVPYGDIYTVYAHVLPLPGISKGVRVQPGQPIGSVNQSGSIRPRPTSPTDCSGSHVHVCRIRLDADSVSDPDLSCNNSHGVAFNPPLCGNPAHQVNCPQLKYPPSAGCRLWNQ